MQRRLRGRSSSGQSPGANFPAALFLTVLSRSITCGKSGGGGGNLGGATAWAEPIVFQSNGAVVEVPLTVSTHTYDDGIFKFSSRVYNGAFTGPTIRVRPGQMLRLTLVNELGGSYVSAPDHDHNTFHNANTTNIHLHGLMPSGGVFDVAVRVGPGERRVFELVIDPNTPPGTQWYHPHVHGSTALQVGGGLAGALVVYHDDERASRSRSGRLGGQADYDDDDLSSEDDDRGIHMQEHIVLLQQLQFTDGARPSHGRVYNYRRIAEASHDGLRVYKAPEDAVNGSSIVVNGLRTPAVVINVGEPHLFRIVNAGGSTFVELGVREADPQQGAGCTLKLIATDGVSLFQTRSIDLQDGVALPPGGRADFVFTCHRVGTATVVSSPLASFDQFVGEKSERFSGDLFLLEVVAPVAPPTGPSLARAPLSSLPLGYSVQDRQLSSVYPDLMSSGSTNHSNSDAPVVTQSFNFSHHHCPDSHGKYCINGLAYSGDSSTPAEHADDPVIVLGSINEWTFRNLDPGMNHPVHLHGVHFQVRAFLLLPILC